MWENLRNDGFDPLDLWEIVGQDRGVLCKAVQIFSVKYPEMLRDIEQAAKQGDKDNVRKVSHKLKSALLQLSAPKAAAVAAELENSASGTSPENLAPLVDDLRTECDALLRSLTAMIREIPEIPVSEF
jgi:HPt (histidine-containing phosphotransfer) domain-containing protein